MKEIDYFTNLTFIVLILMGIMGVLTLNLFYIYSQIIVCCFYGSVLFLGD